MNELLEALNKKFDDKYLYLKLFEVVYDKNNFVCIFTFLFPVTMDEIDGNSRKEIELFVKEFFSLNADVRVKFKKSFLDEKLIRIEIKNFFEEKHKSLMPFFKDENITSVNDNLDVKVKIEFNQDVVEMIDEAKIKKEIIEYLNKKFIANFDVSIIKCEEKLPQEIDFEDVYLPQKRKTLRYDVNIENELIGTGIAPKPELIENISKPKMSVILAGLIGNFTQKTFIAKKGKSAGEERYYYTFTLNDGKTIDCIYFCGKSNLKKMEILADNTMILCLGDVEYGLSGKLTYRIKKIALASPKIQELQEEKEENNTPIQIHRKMVASIEPIVTQSQSNLFESKAVYNENIMSHTIVVFDIETTGLDPETCEITEIGAVKIVEGVIKERFSSFVKPSVPIPEEVQQLTHITDDMVKDAPPIESVIADFYDWTRGCVLSGYNVIGFDMKFIKKAGQKYNYKFDNEIVDTMIVVRSSGLRCTNYKLGTVVNALGLTLEGAHRAYNDAHATAQVLLALSKV